MKVKILIASDSFKDSLSSKEVGKYLKTGMEEFGNLKIDILEVGDGGEGSLESLLEHHNGKKVFLNAKDPLFREIETYYGIINRFAVIEMAKISGLQLLGIKERNPMYTSTIGTGELIKDALNKGYRKFLITIGGSATCDGGIGMATALGYKFIDKDSNEISPIGANLTKIAYIDTKNVDRRIFESSFTVACDVVNPFYGKDGASYTYSKQKGANSKEIEFLDSGLEHLSEIIQRDLGKDISGLKGSGAAGGLGGGLVAFVNAKLKSGVDVILDILNFKSIVQKYDIVITGEGRIDDQTLNGKTITGIVKIAKQYNKKVIVIGGIVKRSAYKLYDIGVDLLLSIQQEPISIEKSIKESKELLRRTGILIARILRF